ncbi:hypothetical protein KFE25_001982 [Diacronema lutheri]|uniref:Uncharacterized protein n=1 Tax=Diacronema lutheri TaxID=2081491 RepID=A0A8J5XCN0_DIALT|nr:hypothetical protein KFE25_001982 [Diacronema lutheri]
MGGGVSVVPDFISIFGDVARTSPNAGQLLSGSADGLIMVACATACATWIQTLVRDLCWGAPARQAFSRLYLAVGLLYVLCGCAYAAYALSLLHFSTYVLWTARDGPPFAGLAVVVFALGCGTFWQPLRTEVYELLVRIGEGVSAAAGIAELLGGLPPDEVIARAKATFRALPLSALTVEHLARPVAAGQLRRTSRMRALLSARPRLRSTADRLSANAHDSVSSRQSARVVPTLAACGLAQSDGPAGAEDAPRGAPSPPPDRMLASSFASLHADGELSSQERLAFSAPALLGAVDAFISHSWHDDPQLKFAALQAWRREFVEAHGREPTVWFDALCIDQDNIAAQLPSVPIYLAGCKSVLALAGPTYFQRLWCVLELHIVHQMGGSLDQIFFVPLDGEGERTVGTAGAQPARAGALGVEHVRGAPAFDVQRAAASDPDDQARLLAVIEGSGEGLAAFNEWVCATLLPAAAVRRQAERAVGAKLAGVSATRQSR